MVEEYNGLEVWSFHDTGDRILIGTPRFPRGVRLRQRRFSRLTCEGRDGGMCARSCAGDDLLLKTPKQLYRCDGDRLTLVAKETPYEYFCCDKFRAAVGAFQGARIPHRRDFSVAATYDLTSADRSPVV